jgi:hypothetical protein
MSEERVEWLIERGYTEAEPRTVWLKHTAVTPATEKEWTTDVNEAAMFPEREMAEKWIADNGLDARAVEHAWFVPEDGVVIDVNMDEKSPPTSRWYEPLKAITELHHRDPAADTTGQEGT